MKPEFYLENINPLAAKKFKHLYELDVLETRVRQQFSYQILIPEDTLQKAKAQAKAWAKQEGVEVLSVKEIYDIPKL